MNCKQTGFILLKINLKELSPRRQTFCVPDHLVPETLLQEPSAPPLHLPVQVVAPPGEHLLLVGPALHPAVQGEEGHLVMVKGGSSPPAQG